MMGEKMKHLKPSTLDWQLTASYSQRKVKENRNCIDIIRGVVMRELNTGRGNKEGRYMEGETRIMQQCPLIMTIVFRYPGFHWYSNTAASSFYQQ